MGECGSDRDSRKLPPTTVKCSASTLGPTRLRNNSMDRIGAWNEPSEVAKDTQNENLLKQHTIRD